MKFGMLYCSEDGEGSGVGFVEISWTFTMQGAIFFRMASLDWANPQVNFTDTPSDTCARKIPSDCSERFSIACQYFFISYGEKSDAGVHKSFMRFYSMNRTLTDCSCTHGAPRLFDGTWTFCTLIHSAHCMWIYMIAEISEIPCSVTVIFTSNSVLMN